MSTFKKLGLAPALLSSIEKLGYETPTAIQEQSIPILMEGGDLLAQAQTGTGKTAAFALPILQHIDLTIKQPQAIILAPTRELAIQVAEAFQSYARNLNGFFVTPIYGGQDYQVQLKALKRGTHIVVGTPGRVMDHIRRGTLKFDALETVVLDEADEMLNMGFISDIEWILEQIPHEHQTALFSATMPKAIKSIARNYLQEAERIHIKPTKSTVDSIEQCYTRVGRNQKLEVLTRFLEVEDIQAAIIFARTKTCSAELAEKLQARGYAAAALNGDMSQSLRKQAIDRIKKGSLDILVATDVAARGIDVERISHVINYDIPYDTESYIHRIGRTGRAGRKGKAVLFVAPNEFRLFKDIQRAVNDAVVEVEPPSIKEMNDVRKKQLAEKVINIIEKSNKLQPYRDMITDIEAQSGHTAAEIAATLAYLIQQANPLPTEELAPPQQDGDRDRKRRRKRPSNNSNNTNNRHKPFKKSSSANHRSDFKKRPPKRAKRGDKR